VSGWIRAAAHRRSLFALVLAASVACAACSSGEASSSVARAPEGAEARLPSKILGLKVVRENVRANLSNVQKTYLQSVGLFSFREGDDLLRATIQVGRFNDVAEPRKERFRNAIIGQLGSTVPIQLRVGDRAVYLASGSEQNIFSWFDDVGFYVLSIRSDYAFPRSLLRQLLDRNLQA
jgi:hypothetical protein